MADVFVSYKAEDRRRVKPLVDALQADGFSVWWDAQIGGGSAWRQEIETELNAAKCVLVVWSKRSAGPEGAFVQDEASRAQQRHVYVPVIIDKVHLPLGFGETQELPLTGWRGDRSDARYQSLLSAVRRVSGEVVFPAALPAAPARKVTRRALLAGASIAVAGAAFGAWAWLRPSAASASNSIAVLPFANLSGDPGQAYFSDGMAEEIRSALARIAQLQVVARTSSELVRNDDPETAARKLHVANILMGSIRRSPSLIRVSAQLIDPATGVERWSAVYDRAPGDVLRIQSDIAQKVAQALSLRLAPVRGNLLTIGGTTNPRAQELFLKAVALRESGLNETVLKDSIQLLDQAIGIDSEYAKAYAERGRMAAELSGYYPAASDYEKGYAQAIADARQAIAIAPEMAAGYATFGIAHELGNEFADALREYERAVSHANVDADTIATFASFLAQLGFMTRALSLADRAIAIDPLNSRPYDVRATAYFFGRRYPGALNAARAVLQMAPSDSRSLTIIGFSQVQMGQLDDALSTFRQIASSDFRRLVGEAIVEVRMGNQASSQQLLNQLRRTSGDAADFQQAEILTQQRKNDQAFAALDRALKVRDPGLIYLLSDPFLDELREDPRFKPFAARLNFPKSTD